MLGFYCVFLFYVFYILYKKKKKKSFHILPCCGQQAIGLFKPTFYCASFVDHEGKNRVPVQLLC